MAEFPQSRTEEILYATINGEEYTGLPESRIEELLLELKEVIEEGGGGGGAVDSVNGQTGVVVLDAEDVGALPDDTTIPTKTSDLTNDSGFQTASDVAAAISGKVDTSAVGTTVASLTDGKVPASQLPSYVDDVIEAEDVMHFPVTGESGKIYVALDTNKTYRWSGSGYVEISESLALGETSSTAYAGNKGKANADAIDAIKDGTTIDSFSDVESALAGKADSATTLAGYGITDAYTKSSVDTALALKADKSELPDVATASDVGLVKPDGTTVTVDANGVLTAVGGGSGNTKLKTRYSISYSSWSSSPNSDGYYTYSLTLSPTLDTTVSPDVLIAGSSNTSQPTDTHRTMFEYVERCYLSGSSLTLYAKTKPTSTFYIWVKGVAGSGSGSIVGNVIQPNGASGGGGFSWDSLFSTNETVIGTVGGKTLYARTFHTSNLPNNSSMIVATMNYTNIKILFGMAYRADISAQYPEMRPLPFSGGGENDIRLDQMGGAIRIVTFTDWSAYVADVTAIYTKTS